MKVTEAFRNLTHAFPIFTFVWPLTWACSRSTTKACILIASTFARAEFIPKRTFHRNRTVLNRWSTRAIMTLHWSLSWTVGNGRTVLKRGPTRAISETMEGIWIYVMTTWKHYLLRSIIYAWTRLSIRVNTRFIPTFNESNRTRWSWWTIGKGISTSH